MHYCDFHLVLLKTERFPHGQWNCMKIHEYLGPVFVKGYVLFMSLIRTAHAAQS